MCFGMELHTGYQESINHFIKELKVKIPLKKNNVTYNINNFFGVNFTCRVLHSM